MSRMMALHSVYTSRYLLLDVKSSTLDAKQNTQSPRGWVGSIFVICIELAEALYALPDKQSPDKRCCASRNLCFRINQLATPIDTDTARSFEVPLLACFLVKRPKTEEPPIGAALLF